MKGERGVEGTEVTRFDHAPITVLVRNESRAIHHVIRALLEWILLPHSVTATLINRLSAAEISLGVLFPSSTKNGMNFWNGTK